jgi:hypothetical protein
MLSGDFNNALDVCFLNEGDSTISASSFANQSGSGNVPTLVADYVDDFQTPNPTANWQYIWNENGEFGNTANYSSLTWESWRYQ